MEKIIERFIERIGKKTSKQFLRFSLIGVLNFIVGYSTYLLFLNGLNLHYFWALTLSHIIAVFHSYFWNRYWSFQSNDKYLKEILSFFAIYTFGFILNLLLLPLLVEIIKLEPGPAQLIFLVFITLVNLIFNFLGLKFWTFRKVK